MLKLFLELALGIILFGSMLWCGAWVIKNDQAQEQAIAAECAKAVCPLPSKAQVIRIEGQRSICVCTPPIGH